MNFDSEEDALLLPSIVPPDFMPPPQHLIASDATTTPTPTITTSTTTMALPDHNPLNVLPY